MYKHLIWALPLLLSASFFMSCENDKAPEPTAPEFCDTLSMTTYNTGIKDILDNNCAFAGCHSSSDTQGDFTTYAAMETYLTDDLFKARVLVQADMPPAGFPPLSPEDLERIECWVSAGYPEN